jgi:predicted dehydrogenase
VTVAVASIPRLGFAGVGFVGSRRMEALVAAGAAEVAAAADPAAPALDGVEVLDDFEELLDRDPDGLVVASPNVFHAGQAIAGLTRGLPVFCQKPLGVDAAEARRVVEAARRADRLLGLDLSYRHTAAVAGMRAVMESGELGDLFAADLVFHNAYGPRPWFWDRALSGGGCALDLATHLVDLALWLLDFPDVTGVRSRLYRGGRRLEPDEEAVEDYAVAELDLSDGAVVRIACSWNLHAGRDCVIEAAFHGTRGSVGLRNHEGSYYDFVAEHHHGTRTQILAEPPDDWTGRAVVGWARRVAAGVGFDPRAEQFVRVAEVVDRIYGRPACGC